MNYVRKGYGCILVVALLVSMGCSMLRGENGASPASTPVVTPPPITTPVIIIPPVPQPEPQPKDQTPVENHSGQENNVVPPGSNVREEDSNRGKHLEAVYFGFNIHDLSDETKKALDRNFAVLDKDKSVYTVEGYCDERGSASYNIALGQKRAEKAKKYLEAMGISANRLNITSYGLEYPADSGSTEQAYQKNRRVEFWILGSPEPGKRAK